MLFPAEQIGDFPKSTGDFFAPADVDSLTPIIAAYRRDRLKMEEISKIIQSDYSNLISFFVEGNFNDERNTISSRYNSISGLFNIEGGIRALNAHYWQKVFNMTDVYQCMPQNRRSEWNEQIRKMEAPDFEEDTVKTTIADLLMSRSRFLAERVDGMFRALSREHVTNRPEGFYKRMILNYCFPYGFADHTRAGYVDDLRAVIAKIQGRGEMKYGSTSPILNNLYKGRTGEWVSVDGGAVRIRVYKKGTIHLEVHPEIAWRLNEILSELHPAAIPSQFRKPMRAPKSFELRSDLLHLDVIEALSRVNNRYTERYGYWSIDMDLNNPKVKDGVCEVIESLGGWVLDRRSKRPNFAFEYNPSSVLSEIVRTGHLPDRKSHQFYPTKERLANIAVKMAKIEEGHECLEPSAGLAGLARFMPKGRTRCIEVNSVFAKALIKQGYNVECADFIEWASKTSLRFDRIVMNPPFSENRWRNHLFAAIDMLVDGGRLVAILPETAMSLSNLPKGKIVAMSEPIEDEFEGASVTVLIMVVEV